MKLYIYKFILYYMIFLSFLLHFHGLFSCYYLFIFIVTKCTPNNVQHDAQVIYVFLVLIISF
jgi:hypothetical protein